MDIDLDGGPRLSGGGWLRDPRSPTPHSIVESVRDGTLDASLAALLWLLVEARVPLVVAAGPSGTGKSTLLHAFLELLPTGTRIQELAGYAEDFAWLPEAGTLGWRPHGFGGVAAPAGRATSPPVATPVEPSTTVLLVHEFSGHLPIYTWGEVARVAVRALSMGYGLGATIHADSLEEVLDELAGPEVGLTADELSRLGAVLVMRAFRDRATGVVLRRVVAAHYVRPVVRDAAGHVQRLGPAVLATWDPGTDTFEDFAWGIVPELAERIGMKAGDFERERTRRADYLRGLVRAGMVERDDVRAAVGHYRHGVPDRDGAAGA
jgi:energy-coupling factor transporter ATP-binding protein EcfA2